MVFIRPLFWLAVLLLWAWITKNPQRRKRLLIICFFLAFLFSNKFLVNEISVAWEPGSIKKGAEIPRVAVVLGGYAEYDESRNRIQFTEAAERLFEAISLYKKGEIDTILLSGGAASLTSRLKPESIYVREYLIQTGIKSEDIWIDTSSKNTWENAVFTRKLLDEKKYSKNVLLITSAFHMKRALGCFRKAGIPCGPHCVQYFGNPGRGYMFADFFIPSSEALFRFDAISKEWVGYLIYKISGKI